MPLCDRSSRGTDGAECPFEWHALRVRANRESTVSRDLQAAGITEFLPLYSTESRWSDRIKTIQKPLFPGYTFARFGALDDRPRRIRGVVQTLGPIPDAEIAEVRRLVEYMKNIEPCPYVAGELVTVASGSLEGMTGVVTRVKGARRLVVSLELLHRSISVELPADVVIHCEEAPEKQLRLAA